jgi:hypothetical protein
MLWTIIASINKEENRMKKNSWFLVCLIVIGLSGVVFAREAGKSYDQQTAENLPLPVHYTFNASIPSGNTLVLPQSTAGTFYSQSEKVMVEGLDVFRVEDWSVSPSSTTINVVANFYNEVTAKVDKSIGSATLKVYAKSTVKLASVTMNMGENYILTANKYTLVDFLVSRKSIQGPTVTVTLNITVRKALSTIANNVDYQVVTMAATTPTLVNMESYRASNICNYGTTTVFLGDASVSDSSYGVALNSSNGRCIGFSDISFKGYAYSTAIATLNITTVK